LQSRAR